MTEEQGASAEPTGPSQAEPVVSALRASVPSASNFYRTCKNCAFDPRSCERRSAIEAGVKGLGLLGVTFRCSQRQPFFRKGQRVGVTWKFVLPEWGWGYEDGISEETWPATVVAETKRGFRIVVDDVLSDNDTPARSYIKSDSLYCNVTAGRLEPLDEPDRQVCGHCGSADNGDGTVTGCWADNNGCDGMFPINNCLAQAMSAGTAETQSGSGRQPASAVVKDDAPIADGQPVDREGDDG